VEEVVDLITRITTPSRAPSKTSPPEPCCGGLHRGCVGYLVFIDYLLRLDELLWRSQLPWSTWWS